MNDIQVIGFVDEEENLERDDRMTSLQIAEVTGKQHYNVMKAIRKMEPAWQKVNEVNFDLVDYIDKKGEQRPCYSLTKEECLYIATKFNDEARAKLIKRWRELEEKHQAKTSLPSYQIEDPIDRAERWIAEQKEKQQLALENKRQMETITAITNENAELGNKIAEMLPKVNYYDQILASNGTCAITQIAQDYGKSGMAMNKLLESLGIQRKVHGQWIIAAKYAPQGYIHSKPVQIVRNDGRQDTKYNTEWTTKGRLFLYEILKKNGILPCIEQSALDRQKAKQEQQSQKP